MNMPAVHRITPIHKKRQSIVLHLGVIVLALTALALRPNTVHADGECQTIGSGITCPVLGPPPDLLNLNQSLYAATAAQSQSLQTLEKQAVTNTITDHGLPASDTNAVESWGRYDAEGELFALLVQAIQASPRTTDQQNAVDWLAAVEQRQNVAAAQDAGLEYVKWAGLDTTAYQQLLNSSATTESGLQSFLSGSVQTYNLLGTNGVPLDPSQFAQSTGGYCVYRSPAPYASEYTGYTDPTCSAPCSSFLGCNPPTPSYDQFTKWGEADAYNSLMNSSQYADASAALATGLAFAGAVVGAGVTGAALSSALSGVLVGSALQEAIFPWLTTTIESAAEGTLTGVEVGELAGTATAGAVGTIAGVAIVALTIAVMEGITVVNAATLPGKLATLIDNARTTTPDAASLLSDSNGASSLYSLFVGATLPVPTNQTCDNSNTSTEPGLTVISGQVIIENKTPCLNPTPIPPASPTDPQFIVQAKGATAKTLSPTISWRDTAIGITTTARLGGNWFIDQVNGSTSSVQTLSIPYTDWNGTEQNVWLVGNPTDGYHFVGVAVSSGTSTSVDPSTCLANGVCWSSPSIDYVGSDGQDYSASVQGYTPSVGSPSYSTAVEGSPATFSANGFKPGNATGNVTYKWQFQLAGCGIPCTTVDLGPPITSGPAYTDPVAGDTVSYTWQTSGSYLVQLTATDSIGVQATDTFTVSVGDVPPSAQVSPDCASFTGVTTAQCDVRTGDVGTSLTVTGMVNHSGTLDEETVTVSWGDGSSDTVRGGQLWFTIHDPSGDPITLTASADQTSYTLSGSHKYAGPGVYYGTVQVSDQSGGTDSSAFTETVHGPQSITFPTIPTHSYGDAPFAISATGGGSGKAVTFASTDTTVCTVSGATSGVDGSGNGIGTATVTVLKPGTCALTASQAGDALYPAASDVTQRFTVQPAPFTVTASSPSITYGGTEPAITPSYSGFVNNETASVLTTQATCSVAPNSGAAGTYQTTCTGASDPNYSITYVPGTLSINQAPLTVTANNKSMTYGGSVPTFDAGFSGLLNGDSNNAVSGLTCGAVDGSKNPVSGSTPAGQYPITCFGGTAANYAIRYQSGTLTINKANTSVSLTSVPAPSVFGQTATFTATLRVTAPGAGTPTGTVTFSDGSTTLGTGTLSTSNGLTTATLSTSSLTPGPHTITASYGGNATFSSSSGSLTQTVSQAASSTTQPTSQTVQDGQSVTFTAAASGYPTPTIQWQVEAAGSTTWSNVSGATTSSLTLTASLAQSGTQYRAVFTNTQGSATSAAATLTVTKRSTTVTLVSSLNPSVSGQLVTFKATVTASTGTPTGWVSFSYQNNGTTVIGFAALTNGVASFSTSGLSAGTHTITATYTGTSPYAGSTSSPLSQQVS